MKKYFLICATSFLMLTSCEKGPTFIMSKYQQKYPNSFVYVNYAKDVIIIDTTGSVYFIVIYKESAETSSIVKLK